MSPAAAKLITLLLTTVMLWPPLSFSALDCIDGLEVGGDVDITFDCSTSESTPSVTYSANFNVQEGHISILYTCSNSTHNQIDEVVLANDARLRTRPSYVIDPSKSFDAGVQCTMTGCYDHYVYLTGMTISRAIQPTTCTIGPSIETSAFASSTSSTISPSTTDPISGMTYTHTASPTVSSKSTLTVMTSLQTGLTHTPTVFTPTVSDKSTVTNEAMTFTDSPSTGLSHGPPVFLPTVSSKSTVTQPTAVNPTNSPLSGHGANIRTTIVTAAYIAAATVVAAIVVVAIIIISTKYQSTRSKDTFPSGLVVAEVDPNFEPVEIHKRMVVSESVHTILHSLTFKDEHDDNAETVIEETDEVIDYQDTSCTTLKAQSEQTSILLASSEVPLASVYVSPNDQKGTSFTTSSEIVLGKQTMSEGYISEFMPESYILVPEPSCSYNLSDDNLGTMQELYFLPALCENSLSS